MSANEPEDFWAADEFEETVAAALIACFETKFKKNKGAAPWDRLTEERVAVLRQMGPYIASNSRGILGPADECLSGGWTFDIANDPLPVAGLYATTPGGPILRERPTCYLVSIYLRQAKALGRCWHTRRAGTLYEFILLCAEVDGIHGERRYLTVAEDGEVIACTQRLQHDSRTSNFGRVAGVIEHDETWLRETTTWGAVGLQMIADRRFCWVISAKEKYAKAHLGCMQEEIKSLLYARSLPMSATGRKRPILHLVESHKRRMQSGIDVDISSFLRGTQTVEIAGTIFTVNPPRSLRPLLSKASQRFYEPTASAGLLADAVAIATGSAS